MLDVVSDCLMLTCVHSSSVSWERSLLDEVTAAHWTLSQDLGLRSGQVAHSDGLQRLPKSGVFLRPSVLLTNCQPRQALLFSPQILQSVLPWGLTISTPRVEDIFEKLVARPENKNYTIRFFKESN